MSYPKHAGLDFILFSWRKLCVSLMFLRCYKMAVQQSQSQQVFLVEFCELKVHYGRQSYLSCWVYKGLKIDISTAGGKPGCLWGSKNPKSAQPVPPQKGLMNQTKDSTGSLAGKAMLPPVQGKNKIKNGSKRSLCPADILIEVEELTYFALDLPRF